MVRVRTALVPLVVGLLLAGCGSDDDPGSSAAVATGNPDTCTGEVVDVVVSVAQWGDVVRQVGGDCANVTTFVADPGGAEPGKADLAAFSDADLVVVNGAGYDSWAEDAAASQDREPRGAERRRAGRRGGRRSAPLVRAAGGARRGAGPGRRARRALPRRRRRLRGERGDLAGGRCAPTWTPSWRSARPSAAGPTRPPGRRSTGWPRPWAWSTSRRRATAASGDDLAAFEAALTDGSVDVLVHDPADGDVPEQLEAAAEAAGVPVLEVTEFAGRRALPRVAAGPAVGAVGGPRRHALTAR